MEAKQKNYLGLAKVARKGSTSPFLIRKNPGKMLLYCSAE